MNRIFFVMALAMVAMSTVSARDNRPKTQFPYPAVPDTISTLQGRANYYVTHFWDHADLKRSFSNRKAFVESFDDYMSMMPHASAEVAQASVDAFVERMRKVPDQIEFVGTLARGSLYSDSALFWSDALLLPFADAVAQGKKVSAAERNEMARIGRTLRNCRQGLPMPGFDVTRPDGATAPGWVADDSASFQVLFFNNPAAPGADEARRRLDTDVLVSRLIDAGLVKVTSIYPGDASDPSFGRMVALLPNGWSAGAAPALKQTLDVRSVPSFYVITGQGYIVEKNLSVEGVLSILYRLRRLKAAQPKIVTTSPEASTTDQSEQ